MLMQVSLCKAGSRIRTGPTHFKHKDVTVALLQAILEDLLLIIITTTSTYLRR
jgi:hypothetical protein